MVKVKKILECVCFSCGKLKVDMVRGFVTTLFLAYSSQRDPLVVNVVRRIKSQHRLKAVWALASKRHVCEPDSLEEDENGDATMEDQYRREQGQGSKAPGHGGCGHEQPVWRKEGLKLVAVIKAAAAEKGEVSLTFLPRMVIEEMAGGG